MELELKDGYSSIQAIAELIESRLEPGLKTNHKYEMEELIEEARNAYSHVLWINYMNGLRDPDLRIMEPLLQRKGFDFTGTPAVIDISDLQIVNLPRDAGVFQVLPYGKDRVYVGSSLTKTNSTQAQVKHKINPGFRYYRIGDNLFFPDGLPDCTTGVEIVFYGLVKSVDDIIFIPRDFAMQTRDKVWESLFPSKQIPEDNTNNAIPDA